MTPDQYAHVIKKLMDIETLLKEVLEYRQLEQTLTKPCPKQYLHPTTMVIEVCSKILDEEYTATAVRVLLPASERSGERKAVVEASLHQAGATESTIMALGKVLGMVGLQNPKKVLIRVVCDYDVVHIIDTGADNCEGLSWSKKAQYLAEDIQALRKHVEIQTESLTPENPEYDELMGLIFEAETEYYQRREKENEPRSTGNSSSV